MSGRTAATYNASAYLLVTARTHRPDPLNNFRMYKGGWNLTNTSYLASAGYTGMPLFAICLIWIFMGFTFIIVVTCMYFCWKDHLKSEPDFGRFGNYSTLILVIAFTVVTISGCGALFTGQEELRSDLSEVFTYLTTQVAQAANDSVQAVPPTAVPDATHAAEVIENATSYISISVHHTLDQVCLWLIIIGSSVLALSLIGLGEDIKLHAICAPDNSPCVESVSSQGVDELYFVVGLTIGTAFVICRIQAIIYFFVAIGWLVVIGLWFLGGIFLLIYAVFGDTCAAIDEWTANPRNGTAFDIIVRCELNHTKPARGHRHTSLGKLPTTEEDSIPFPEYKPLSDLSHLPALPPITNDETPFPEYESLNDIHPAAVDNEIPFPEYKSVNDTYNPDYDPYPIDDPNDANEQNREFWMQLTIQQKDAASENESCIILRQAFVPILDTISKFNCPGILRNTLWVTLAMVTLSGGSMFSICLWIVITRRSTMRLRKMVPADNQLPFYAYVFQDVGSAGVPAPVVPAPAAKKNDYAAYYNAGANPNYNARARRPARVYEAYRSPAERSVNMNAAGRRRK